MFIEKIYNPFKESTAACYTILQKYNTEEAQ